MKIKEVIFLFLLILITPVAVAQSTFTVALQFQDSAGMPAYLETKNFLTDETKTWTQNIPGDNRIDLQLSEGFHEISVGIDDSVTPGFDTFGVVSTNVDADNTIPVTLRPVGSRMIVAIDKFNKPIQSVPIRVDCNSRFGVQGYFRSDDFGVAEANFLPVGECSFRAAVGESVIVVEDMIEQGSSGEIKIVFEDYSRNGKLPFWVYALLIVIIVAALFFLFRKRNKVDSKKLVKDMSKGSASKDDIIRALGDSEKKVVRFMLEEQEKHLHKGGKQKDFYLYQARIVYGASIAKTTLVRILQSLEKKSIIHIEKFGKLKKVRFTDWFNLK